MTNTDGVIVQSVARAINILEYFSGDNKELGISEIADKMQLSKSTIFGLVNTLNAYGYLEQNKENKKYHLGIKLFELGNIVEKRLDLRNEARPYCELLAKKYKFTVHLAALFDGRLIYIDKVDGPAVMVVYSKIGRDVPMHCTGVGKAILAYMPKSFVESYVLNKKLVGYTPNTITTKDSLLKELEKVSIHGYSQEKEEIEFGLRCVAAPIFNDKAEPIAAISISAPVGRMPDELVNEVAEDVKHYAFKISERLGFK
jgi:DNA-binding IclR family transcriptional regulator